jgi:hypothetical protein
LKQKKGGKDKEAADKKAADNDKELTRRTSVSRWQNRNTERTIDNVSRGQRYYNL